MQAKKETLPMIPLTPAARTRRRISNAFEGALRLPLCPCSKYILLSDCHRGVGNANDNFLSNEYLYLAALQHYFRRGFTYLELGDGDELDRKSVV